MRQDKIRGELRMDEELFVKTVRTLNDAKNYLVLLDLPDFEVRTQDLINDLKEAYRL